LRGVKRIIRARGGLRGDEYPNGDAQERKLRVKSCSKTSKSAKEAEEK